MLDVYVSNCFLESISEQRKRYSDINGYLWKPTNWPKATFTLLLTGAAAEAGKRLPVSCEGYTLLPHHLRHRSETRILLPPDFSHPILFLATLPFTEKNQIALERMAYIEIQVHTRYLYISFNRNIYLLFKR